MGIGNSHDPKDDENKGFPTKAIFSPAGSSPPLEFMPFKIGNHDYKLSKGFIYYIFFE